MPQAAPRGGLPQPLEEGGRLATGGRRAALPGTDGGRWRRAWLSGVPRWSGRLYGLTERLRVSVWAAWAAARRLRRQELAEAVLRLRCQAGARQQGAGTRLCVSCGHTVLCAENRVPCALGWDSAPLHILPQLVSSPAPRQPS